MLSQRLFVIIGLGVVVSSVALAKPARLSQEDILRVKEIKRMIHQVDTQTLSQTIHDLEKAGDPHINVQVREAMAKVYVDIIQQQGITSLRQKQWVYSMIALNMAYVQFGGNQSHAGRAEGINALIRQKIKEYLPASVCHHPAFITALD